MKIEGWLRDERGVWIYHPFTYLPPEEQIKIADKFNEGWPSYKPDWIFSRVAG